MKGYSAKLLACVLSAFCLGPTPLLAIDFIAEATMTSAEGQLTTTRIYVGQQRLRKEFYYYGEAVIQILNPQEGRSWMCFRSQQVCYESRSDEQLPTELKAAGENPCANSTGLQCQQHGEEELNGRKAVKWSISTQSGEEAKPESWIWLDQEWHIPVRQDYVNGVRMELIWRGEESVQGRVTDKWTQSITLANGLTQQKNQWFDRELGLSIREEFPNGSIQELSQIEVQDLSDALFSVPENFEVQISQP